MKMTIFFIHGIIWREPIENIIPDFHFLYNAFYVNPLKQLTQSILIGNIYLKVQIVYF